MAKSKPQHFGAISTVLHKAFAENEDVAIAKRRKQLRLELFEFKNRVCRQRIYKSQIETAENEGKSHFDRSRYGLNRK